MSEQYYPQDTVFDERNLPDRSVLPEGRDPHKSTFDLEDVTGNPGHRNSNPNIPPATVEEIVERAAAGPVSINEPPGRAFAAAGVEVAPAAALLAGEGPLSINEPPGSNVREGVEVAGEALPPPQEPQPQQQPGWQQDQQWQSGQQSGWQQQPGQQQQPRQQQFPQPQQPLRPY
jgi:hypothetical protein